MEKPDLMVITDLEIVDIRFPTSKTQAGTDAVHSDPDYSAAYVILRTDRGLDGHGLTFTIGRGNEVCALAIEAFRPHVVGRRLADITNDFGLFWRTLAEDSQLRWLGPEKGVIHLALAAIVNGIWDLYAKAERKPLWKLLADMTPRQLVSCIDFRYITDALTPDEAVDMLERQQRGKPDREAQLLRSGYPAYTTSVGWFGYSDERIRGLCRESLAEGWTHFKVKVGGTPDDDARRVGLVRKEIGPSCRLMIDANQRWEVAEAGFPFPLPSKRHRNRHQYRKCKYENTESIHKPHVRAKTSTVNHPASPNPAIILREIMSVHFREEGVDGIRYVFPTNRFYGGSVRQRDQAARTGGRWLR